MLKVGPGKGLRLGGVKDGLDGAGAPAAVNFVNEPVEGDFSGVRDEGKNGVFEVISNRFKHLAAKRGAEGFALGVDFRVVATGEINALKGAVALGLRGGDDFLNVRGAVAFDNDGMPRCEFVYAFARSVKDRHEGGALGGDGKNLVVVQIITGADAMRIAQDKSVTVADESNEGIGAIPFAGGFAENGGDVEALRYEGRNFRAALVFHIAELVVIAVVLIVEPEADFFEERLCVGGEDGVCAALDKAGVELARVGNVEIARKHEVPRGPDAFAKVRMAGTGVEASGSAIAEMPKEDLAPKVEVHLHRFGHFRDDVGSGDLAVEGIHLPRENVCERLRGRVAVTIHVGVPVGHVEFDATDAGAVLPAVGLFFHEQEELPEAIKRVLVLLLVVGERLEQADQGDAAFVRERVTHGVCDMIVRMGARQLSSGNHCAWFFGDDSGCF